MQSNQLIKNKLRNKIFYFTSEKGKKINININIIDSTIKDSQKNDNEKTINVRTNSDKSRNIIAKGLQVILIISGLIALIAIIALIFKRIPVDTGQNIIISCVGSGSVSLIFRYLYQQK